MEIWPARGDSNLLEHVQLNCCCSTNTHTTLPPPARFRNLHSGDMRYIDNDIRDFQAPAPGKKERRTSKVKKADAVENDRVHAALRLSLQRILRETPPPEGAKSRDFSIYTGGCRHACVYV